MALRRRAESGAEIALKVLKEVWKKWGSLWGCREGKEEERQKTLRLWMENEEESVLFLLESRMLVWMMWEMEEM